MPSLIVSDAVEPILAENPQRFCMFPIKYAEVWEMYKKAEASFWTGVTLFILPHIYLAIARSFPQIPILTVCVFVSML
jgi:hypothetical protein